jgi:uncharacterized membrane protein
MAEREKPGEKTYWLDDRKNVERIWYVLIGTCVLSVIFDLFYHKHVEFSFEDLIPGMYGWYGLVCCIVLVAGARILRAIVRRDESYYDAAAPNEVGDD